MNPPSTIDPKKTRKAPSPKVEKVVEIRNRIVGNEDVSPGLLKAHVMNYRRHPESQMGALRGSLDSLGWVKGVLVSKRTMTIIDGHARVEEAKRRKLPHIPVTYLDLSADEEKQALALLDPISAMAQQDNAVLQTLLDSITVENEAVAKAISKLKPLKDEPQPSETPTSTAILAYTTDVFFPSTNKWGIPDILPNMLYDGDAPTSTWPRENLDGAPQFYIYGSGAFDERVTKNILCFYTEDWRFEGIWQESVDTIRTIVPLHPAAFVQPDFSLWGTDPLVVQMWNIYRARWISRYWQEAGIKCIPSLATSSNHACYEFAFDGLPKRPSLMATQMRNGGFKSKQQVQGESKSICELIERVNPMRLVVYGTSARENIKGYLPGGVEYIWCETFTDASFAKAQKKKADKKMADLSKMQQSVK